MRYVALLRGINVGGNKKVGMDTLKKTLESFGCRDVKTILNSGNVVFDTSMTDKTGLIKRLKEVLQQTFGFEIPVIVCNFSEIQKLVASNPFTKIKVTPKTRLYITFLSKPPKTTSETTYISPKKDFQILTISAGFVCSVLTLSKNRNTTDVMKILEKEFGKEITTRNWNTILKIVNFV